MAYSTTSSPFPGAIFTIPCNHAEAPSTNPASASSSHSSFPSNHYGLGISLKSLEDIWTNISDHTPASVASSAAPTVLSTGTETEAEDAEQSTRPPSDRPDASSAPPAAGTAKSKAEQRAVRSRRRKDSDGPTNTIFRLNRGSVGVSSAGLAQTLAPVYRPQATDSGRVKALLGASGLRIRTRGLQGRSGPLRVFQLGEDSGSSDGGCRMENWVEGIEVLNQPKWVWEAWA